MSNLRQRMIQDMKIRNYSPRTITVYVDRFAKFARYFNQSPDTLTSEHIREFQRYLVENKLCSWSQLNQTVCALRFFYKVCLDRPAMIECIPNPCQMDANALDRSRPSCSPERIFPYSIPIARCRDATSFNKIVFEMLSAF